MVEFDFYLSREDFDKLMDLKDADGKDDLTANEYAKELLEQIIRKRERIQQISSK